MFVHNYNYVCIIYYNSHTTTVCIHYFTILKLSYLSYGVIVVSYYV